MTATIRKYVARELERTGQAPGAEEIARVFAIHVERVRWHLRSIAADARPNKSNGDVRLKRTP